MKPIRQFKILFSVVLAVAFLGLTSAVYAQSISVGTIDELYAAVNNSANAGATIVLAPGVYMLSTTNMSGTPRPNRGRIELQENMALQGVVGDREAVIIDAVNLPTTSFNSAPPIPLTGAIRVGRGYNSIEWLMVRNAVNAAANIETELVSTPSAHIRIAHIISTGGQRGIDVRNFGAASAGRMIEAEIVDNDLYDNTVGTLGEGLRIVNNQGATGGVIFASLAENRSHNNLNGLLIENNRSSLAHITVYSSGDRFFENGLGALIGAGLSAGTTPANGNSVSFTAHGTHFENNNALSFFDIGGLVIVGGENTSIPNGTNNNTVNVSLWGCRYSGNPLADLYGVGARSNPVSIGSPGVNNHVTITINGAGKAAGRWQPIEFFADSLPFDANTTNSVTVIR
jgi:hypothetical protein